MHAIPPNRYVGCQVWRASVVGLYEVRPRNDHRGFDLISDALPFGRLWYAEPDAISNAIGYAKFYSRSHHAVIHVFDQAGAVVETPCDPTKRCLATGFRALWAPDC